MSRILRRRPSPSMIVSLIALFVALGGSAYALTVTGGQVVNGSLTGKDIRKNSLTGRQIRESKLSKVPKAKVADRVGTRTAAQVTTRAFLAAQKTPKGFTGDETEIGRISLPAGTYSIFGKVTTSNTATATLRVTCFLRAGGPGAEDQGTTALQPGSAFGNTQVIPLLLAHSATSSFVVRMTCKAEGNPGLNLFAQPPFTTATNAKIAAIRADDAVITDF